MFRDEGLERMPRAVLCRVLRTRDPVSFRRSLLIDRGAADGIRRDHPVVVGGVYLGRVEVVHAHVSVVKLLTDAQARAEVFVRSSKGKLLRGYARRRGRRDGDDLMAVEFVRRRGDVGEINAGAPVFTASFHPDVPAHLLVGRIDEVSDPDMDAMPTLTMRPAFDLDTTYEVLVLLTDAVRAPRPRAKRGGTTVENGGRAPSRPALSRTGERPRAGG